MIDLLILINHLFLVTSTLQLKKMYFNEECSWFKEECQDQGQYLQRGAILYIYMYVSFLLTRSIITTW
jgi:hypothetical protein